MSLHNNLIELAGKVVGNWLIYMWLKYEVDRSILYREIWIWVEVGEYDRRGYVIRNASSGSGYIIIQSFLQRELCRITRSTMLPSLEKIGWILVA